MFGIASAGDRCRAGSEAVSRPKTAAESLESAREKDEQSSLPGTDWILLASGLPEAGVVLSGWRVTEAESADTCRLGTNPWWEPRSAIAPVSERVDAALKSQGSGALLELVEVQNSPTDRPVIV